MAMVVMTVFGDADAALPPDGGIVHAEWQASIFGVETMEIRLNRPARSPAVSEEITALPAARQTEIPRSGGSPRTSPVAARTSPAALLLNV
jgi:hypothetical protein